MSLFLSASALVLFIIVVYSEMSKKQTAENYLSCDHPPDIKHGKFIPVVDNKSPNKTFCQLTCDDGYYTSKENISITFQRGKWHPTGLYCKESYVTKLYRIILTFVIPSIIGVALIILVTIFVIIRKKRSVEPVPKWTKNKEEREKKYSSEMQEKVYKDLIETTRASFRFPFFRPKGSSTGKKPILLEEDGYLVPERRKKSYDATDVRKIDFQNKGLDLGTAGTKCEVENSPKCETFPKEVITELKQKQSQLPFPSNFKDSPRNQDTTIHQQCNLFQNGQQNLASGSSGACKKNKETTQKLCDLKGNHTYVNMETREDINFKQLMIQEGDGKELQKSTLKQPADVSTSSVPCSSRINPSTKQENDSLKHRQPDLLNASIISPTETYQFEGKSCTSLPQSPENRCLDSGKSINEPSTNLANMCVSTDEHTYIQITDIVIHEEPRNTEKKPLKEKHLYCNIVASTDESDIIEEIYDEAPPKSLHTYANL